ncbi:MAG: hypothetical protein J6T10_31750 [Methanobrevibacter sp.]|nr:hypothetical protein [Methanobrevibacter sp.]
MEPLTSVASTQAEYPVNIYAAAAAVCPVDTVLASVNVPVTDTILSSSAESPTFIVTPSLILAAFIPLVATAFIV